MSKSYKYNRVHRDALDDQIFFSQEIKRYMGTRICLLLYYYYYKSRLRNFYSMFK